MPIDDAEHVPAESLPDDTTEAITLLYGREGGAVYRTIYGIVLDAGEAQRLTVATFLRAYRAWDRFDRTDVRAWLLRIATDLAITHARSVRRRGGKARWTPPGAVAQDQSRAQPGDTDLLAWLLQPLTPEQRALVTLSHYQQVPPTEIANQLGISAVTVASRLNRAMQVLRRRAQAAGALQAREYAAQ